MMGDKTIGVLITLGVVVVIGLILLGMTVYTIPAGERGVLMTWQKPEMMAQGEGLHFKIPIAQHVAIMDVKTQKYVVEKASAASRDMQTVTTDITINYNINPENVPIIYQTIGINYQDKVIVPAVLEVLKASTAQYTAEELITKRPEVKDKIDNNLRDRLREFNIVVQAVSITNFDFSAQFNAAVEGKVTAEQNALGAKNKLAQIEYEAQQRVTQAKGEADAIAIQAQAINAQGGKDYVQLQAIAKWDGKLPMIISSSATPFVDLRSFDSTSSNVNKTI